MNLASPPSAAHCGKTPESGFPGSLASEGGVLTPEHGLMRLFLGQELEERICHTIAGVRVWNRRALPLFIDGKNKV